MKKPSLRSKKRASPLDSALSSYAEYQGQNGKFSLDGKMTVGNIQSRTARRLIREWTSFHRRELEANWENMQAGRPLERIEPLE